MLGVCTGRGVTPHRPVCLISIWVALPFTCHCVAGARCQGVSASLSGAVSEHVIPGGTIFGAGKRGHTAPRAKPSSEIYAVQVHELAHISSINEHLPQLFISCRTVHKCCVPVQVL